MPTMTMKGLGAPLDKMTEAEKDEYIRDLEAASSASHDVLDQLGTPRDTVKQLDGSPIEEVTEHPVHERIGLYAAMKTFPRIGAALVVTDGNKVLLGRRDKEPHRGRWVIPGGRIKPFESIGEAALREMREETGLEVRIVTHFHTFEVINPPDEHRIIIYHFAEPVGGELKAGSDLSEVGFYTAREIIELLPLTPLCRSVLTAAAIIAQSLSCKHCSEPITDGHKRGWYHIDSRVAICADGRALAEPTQR